jgi:hypothetical protein
MTISSTPARSQQRGVAGTPPDGLDCGLVLVELDQLAALLLGVDDQFVVVAA